MNIGKEIKRLRKQKGLSQNELAEVLNVTAQSVSKWESDNSYPDISQLPAIASFFGISIDELFAYPTDLEYARVEKSIENGEPLSNEMFEHSESFLLEQIKKHPDNHKAVSMLGDLYHFHACRLNDKAVHYAMEALRLKPDNKFDINTLNNASNGAINDWNISCHYKLVENLKSLIRNNPEKSDRVKLYLLDNLIADGELKEASQLLEDNPGLKLREIYEAMIVEREKGFDTAKQIYEQLIEKYSENWEILIEVANRMAFHGEFDKAIAVYEQAYEKAPKPRYTDMLACIAGLHRKLGNHKEAVDAYKRELLLLKDEWNITKGEQVETIKANIELLQ